MSLATTHVQSYHLDRNALGVTSNVPTKTFKDSDKGNNKLSQRIRRRFIPPTEFPHIDIPGDTRHVILGIQGYWCGPVALEPGVQQLNAEGIVYVPMDDTLIDIGFTRGITNHIVNFADHLAQRFGQPIDIHGNSLGGFHAFLVAITNPENVRRLYFTACPHQLTMERDSLTQHTNIAAFIGLMKNRPLARMFNQELIDLWSRFRSGDDPEFTRMLNEKIAHIERLSFAGKTDSTVFGKACIESDSPTTRSFAGMGDHSDVIDWAIPIIKYLIDKDIHSELPASLSSPLVGIDELEDLVRKSELSVAFQFIRGSISLDKMLSGLREKIGRRNQPDHHVDTGNLLGIPPTMTPALAVTSSSLNNRDRGVRVIEGRYLDTLHI